MRSILTSELLEKLTADAKNLWPEKFDIYENIVNKCCFSICYDVIVKYKLFRKKGETLSYEDIKKAVNLSPSADYLMSKILSILIEEGILSYSNGFYTCLKTADIEGPAELLVKMTRTFPQEGSPFQWIARAYSGIFSVLSGDVYPEDVMFPWGSFELVEEFYNTSEVYGFYSKLAGITVKRVIEDVFKSKIVMLEAGAGTGNGTANVLNNISTKFEKYIYTDISRGLLKSSKEKFSSFDFMEYKIFDVSKDLSVQNIKPETADIILAVNVLHATADVTASVKNLKSILKPGGVLVLSEIAPPPGSTYRFMDLTFGLLPSYSSYTDKDLRPSGPILRPEKWLEVLMNCGFREYDAVPYDRLDNADRGGVVLAVK